LRIGDKAVRTKTSKNWQEWFNILDSADATKMNHEEIVDFLSHNFDVGPWWEQMITVTYEQTRGLRNRHEKPQGYKISCTKTISAKVADIYEAWENKSKRGKWLTNSQVKIRKSTPVKSMPIIWINGKTSVEVNFYPKGSNKIQVTVQHSKLSDANAAKTIKHYWEENLKKLKNFVE